MEIKRFLSKNFKLLLGIFFILFFIISFFAISSQNVSYIGLVKGKNYIVINLDEPMFVKDIVKLNPDIEVVSYFKDNKSIGYVNIFGGIGENFVIEKNKTYEIIVKENMTLMSPKS